MRWFHVCLAVLALGAFGGTGLYMHFGHDHLRDTEVAIRAFWRSRHIYLLLIGLCELMLVAYARPMAKYRWLQFAGSTLFGMATVAIAIAFFVEVDEPTLRSPLSGWAIRGLVLGAVLHLFAGVRGQRDIGDAL